MGGGLFYAQFQSYNSDCGSRCGGGGLGGEVLSPCCVGDSAAVRLDLYLVREKGIFSPYCNSGAALADLSKGPRPRSTLGVPGREAADVGKGRNGGMGGHGRGSH